MSGEPLAAPDVAALKAELDKLKKENEALKAENAEHETWKALLKNASDAWGYNKDDLVYNLETFTHEEGLIRKSQDATDPLMRLGRQPDRPPGSHQASLQIDLTKQKLTEANASLHEIEENKYAFYRNVATKLDRDYKFPKRAARKYLAAAHETLSQYEAILKLESNVVKIQKFARVASDMLIEWIKAFEEAIATAPSPEPLSVDSLSEPTGGSPAPEPKGTKRQGSPLQPPKHQRKHPPGAFDEVTDSEDEEGTDTGRPFSHVVV